MMTTFSAMWDMPLVGMPRTSRIRLLKDLSRDALFAMIELPEEPTQALRPLRRHSRLDSITELTSVLQLSPSLTLAHKDVLCLQECYSSLVCGGDFRGRIIAGKLISQKSST